MRRNLIPAVSLTMFLLFTVHTLYSQIRTRVDLVVVPVSVRDDNGFLITGLIKEDFSILEDGRPQTIMNFSVDAQPLSAAVVIDDGVSGAELKEVADALPQLAGAFTPDDEVTTFRYDHLVWRLSDFTRDPQQLPASFRDVVRLAETRRDEPRQPALYDKIEEKTPGFLRAIAGLFSLGSNGAPGSTTPTAPSPRPASASRVMHSAVYEAAMALQGRPEEHRKLILLVSDGVVAEPQTSVIPGQTLHSFDKNTALLAKNEIQVFGINTKADLLDRKGGALTSYANATGGDVYGGSSKGDTGFAFGRIAEQARTQYVLGYVSNNVAPQQGVYRKIEVRTGDPGLKRSVVHRQGYMQYPAPR